MPSPYRRLNREEGYVITKDFDGNVIKGEDLDGEATSLTFASDKLLVHDITLHDVMTEILSQLKIMNFHLQILTDEEIEEIT